MGQDYFFLKQKMPKEPRNKMSKEPRRVVNKKTKMEIEEEPKPQQVDVTAIANKWMQSQKDICEVLLSLVNKINELEKKN